MACRTVIWVQGPYCQVRWLFEDNKWDPKPFFDALPSPAVRVRLERSAARLAQVGHLPNDKGHLRHGNPPYNKLYEIKDVPSGVRLLAFSFNPSPGAHWYVVALGVTKQGDDITREEEERAVERRQRFLDANQPQGIPQPPARRPTKQRKKRR